MDGLSRAILVCWLNELPVKESLVCRFVMVRSAPSIVEVSLSRAHASLTSSLTEWSVGEKSRSWGAVVSSRVVSSPVDAVPAVLVAVMVMVFLPSLSVTSAENCPLVTVASMAVGVGVVCMVTLFPVSGVSLVTVPVRVMWGVLVAEGKAFTVMLGVCCCSSKDQVLVAVLPRSSVAVISAVYVPGVVSVCVMLVVVS